MRPTIKYQFIIAIVLSSLVFYGCSEDDSDGTAGSTPVAVASYCHNFTSQLLPYDTLIGGNDLEMTKTDSLYKIDLGFDLKVCDSLYRNVYLSGFVFSLSYTDNKPPFPFEFDITDYRISPFGYLNIDAKAVGTQIVSKLVTKTEGPVGSKVTTIEFREYEFGDSHTSDLYDLNCKVIFNELDNSISYHFGETNTIYNFKNDISKQFLVGLFYPNSSQGIFLNGDPSSPTLTNIASDTELDKWPAKGRHYTFTLK